MNCSCCWWLRFALLSHGAPRMHPFCEEGASANPTIGVLGFLFE